jgi:GntR family transcriptional repressor for pyruvate dehydrogenase complex
MNNIDIRQGDGTYTSSLEPELLVEPLDFILTVGGVTNHQLLQARFVVEPPCAFIAAWGPRSDDGAPPPRRGVIPAAGILDVA